MAGYTPSLAMVCHDRQLVSRQGAENHLRARRKGFFVRGRVCLLVLLECLINVFSYPPPVPKPTGGELVPHERPPHRAATVDDQHLSLRDSSKRKVSAGRRLFLAKTETMIYRRRRRERYTAGFKTFKKPTAHACYPLEHARFRYREGVHETQAA